MEADTVAANADQMKASSELTASGGALVRSSLERPCQPPFSPHGPTRLRNRRPVPVAVAVDREHSASHPGAGLALVDSYEVAILPTDLEQGSEQQVLFGVLWGMDQGPWE